MVSAHAGSLQAALAVVPDPRERKGRRFGLSAILTAVVSGILCGVRGFTDLVEWLHDQEPEVWHWMGFTRRPPKEDCFSRVLEVLEPAAFERALWNWLSCCCEISEDDIETISIDGKVMCGSLRQHLPAVTLLAAVDHKTGCVFQQCRVASDTNEHKAALSMLKEMVLKGKLVVGDAAFCQRDLCQQIIDDGGDYLLPVKDNQPGLLRDIELEFAAEDAAFSPLPAAAARVGTRCHSHA